MTSSRQSVRRRALLLMILALLPGSLGACGQIGPLYLPDEPAPAPATESPDEEPEGADDS